MAAISAAARQLFALEASLAAGDPRSAAVALGQGELPDWPEGRDLIERARRAAQCVADLDRLQTEVQATRDGRRLVQLWDELGPSLADIPEAETIGRVAASWRRRLQACAALGTAVAATPQCEATIARAWDALRAAGGHPDAVVWQPRAAQARKRAPALEEARRLAAAPADEDGDRRLCQVWDEGGLEHCPEAEPLRPRVAAARPRIVLLDDLKRLLGRGATEEQIVARAAPLGKKYTYRLRPRVETARQRVAAFAALREAVERGGDDRAIEQAWARLEEAGGHPEALHWQAKADTARRRAAVLGRLKALTDLPRDEASDRAFVRVWEGADLNGCAEATPYRVRHVLACESLRAVDQLAALFERGAPLAEVLAVAETIPPDYPHSFQDRVRRAREMLDAQNALRQGHAAVPRSDRALAAAWRNYSRVCPMPLDRALLDDCLLASQRSNYLDALESIDSALPLDEQDRFWTRAWNEALLGPCGDAQPHRKRNREVRERVTAWERLQDAIRSGNAFAVAQLYADPLLSGYPPLERLRFDIAELVERGRRAHRLLDGLKAGDDAAVLHELDLPTIATLPKLFRPHRQWLIRLITDRLKLNPLRRDDPPYEIDEAMRRLTVRWTGWEWSLFGQEDRSCRVAVDARQFFVTPDEAADGTYSPRERSCRAGYVVPLPPGARQVFVTVWAVVPLDVVTFGIREAVGPPLRIGPIPLHGRQNGHNGESGLLRRLLRILSSSGRGV